MFNFISGGSWIFNTLLTIWEGDSAKISIPLLISFFANRNVSVYTKQVMLGKLNESQKRVLAQNEIVLRELSPKPNFQKDVLPKMAKSQDVIWGVENARNTTIAKNKFEQEWLDGYKPFTKSTLSEKERRIRDIKNFQEFRKRKELERIKQKAQSLENVIKRLSKKIDNQVVAEELAKWMISNEIKMSENKILALNQKSSLGLPNNYYWKFKGSSWLNEGYYDDKSKTFMLRLLTSGKTYTFYSVPIVACWVLYEINGREMWNGFGFQYSINPLRWLRRASLAHYYKKIQHYRSNMPALFKYNVNKKLIPKYGAKEVFAKRGGK